MHEPGPRVDRLVCALLGLGWSAIGLATYTLVVEPDWSKWLIGTWFLAGGIATGWLSYRPASPRAAVLAATWVSAACVARVVALAAWYQGPNRVAGFVVGLSAYLMLAGLNLVYWLRAAPHMQARARGYRDRWAELSAEPEGPDDS